MDPSSFGALAHTSYSKNVEAYCYTYYSTTTCPGKVFCQTSDLDVSFAILKALNFVTIESIEDIERSQFFKLLPLLKCGLGVYI